MTRIIREKPTSGKVLGIEVKADGKTINIRATKGVIIATGGHTGNVNFRRMFDPRLTEEYQQACQPYVYQNADGEIAAMDIGASLWATAIQTSESGAAITKTRHIGCRWGYASLVYETDSQMANTARVAIAPIACGSSSSRAMATARRPTSMSSMKPNSRPASAPYAGTAAR